MRNEGGTAIRIKSGHCLSWLRGICLVNNWKGSSMAFLWGRRSAFQLSITQTERPTSLPTIRSWSSRWYQTHTSIPFSATLWWISSCVPMDPSCHVCCIHRNDKAFLQTCKHCLLSLSCFCYPVKSLNQLEQIPYKSTCFWCGSSWRQWGQGILVLLDFSRLITIFLVHQFP